MRILCPVLLILSTAGTAGAEPPLDLVVANGRVVDGSGAPWQRADVGVRDGRIVAVGDLHGAAARRRIDARGHLVAPGFIDMLGQSEYNLLVDNRAESKIRQGITSEITGEGESVAPQSPATRAATEPQLMKYHQRLDWSDFAGYFARLLRTKTAINLGSYVGAQQVRAVVIGVQDAPPSPKQLETMERKVEEAMVQGALGLSSALIYAPGSYAKTDELVALARAAARHGGIYATHLRSESSQIAAALDEAFTIGREAHLPVEIFHLKVAGKPNWGRMPDVVARIERARAEGLDVTADMYPYPASSNSLDSKIPGWAHDGGTKALLARLADPVARERIKREMLNGEPGKEAEYRNVGPDGILVTSCLNPALKPWMGKRLSEIARAQKRSPEDALLDLVVADEAHVNGVNFSMSEDDVRFALARPWISFGLDSGAQATDGPFAGELAHPRGFGALPRVLDHYVREAKLISLEEAVRRMTSLPAHRLGLWERGLLRPGLAADLVVLDADKIRDVATFGDPNRYSEGVEYVVVNGRVVLDAGVMTQERPGVILRRTSRP